MPILLDTHVLIWVAEGAPQLGADAAARINQAGPDGDVLVSVFSFWEVSMLVARRRITLSTTLDDWVAAVVDEPRLTMTPLSPRIAIECHRLPGRIHLDPADRVLVATARDLSATLMTRDREIMRYAEQGHVSVMVV